MKRNLLTQVVVAMAFCLGIATSFTFGQTEDESNAIKTAYQKVSDLISEEKFDDASKIMTPEGVTQFIAQPIVYAVAMSSMDSEMMMGGEDLPEEFAEQIQDQIAAMEEEQAQLKKLLKKHGLDSIEVNDEELTKPGAIEQKVVKWLEGKEDRWALYNEFRVASASPMQSIFGGEFLNAKSVGKTAVVEIKPDYSGMDEMDGGQGGMMEVMGPNMAIKFVNVQGAWVFDGIDYQRTEELMNSFMEDMGMGGTMESALIEDLKFTGKTLEGKKIELQEFQGSVVLVDFWGTWCGPCVAALPELKRIYKAMGKYGFEVVGIALDEREDLEGFLSKTKLPWPNIIDSEGSLSDKFGISAFPTTLLVDENGKHIHTNLHGSELVETIAEQLGLTEDQLNSVKAEISEAKKKAKGARAEKKKKEKADDSKAKGQSELETESDGKVTSGDEEGGFSVADSNGDGQISKKELKSYLQGRLDGEVAFGKIFRKLDEDKNKSLSEVEFENRFNVISEIASESENENVAAAEYHPADFRVPDPGKGFVPYADGNSRVDDKAIFGALANRFVDLVNEHQSDWPPLMFNQLPKGLTTGFSFGSNSMKSVDDLVRSTLILVAEEQKSLVVAGGVVISDDGLAITNYHVAKMAETSRLGALTSDGRCHRVMKVLAGSNEKDVALIQLEGSGFSPVSIAKEAPQAGDDIVMLHHSENRFYTYDRGYVRRNSKIGRNTRMEISAEYAPGGSGCGIFNEDHELVGLVCEINMGDGPDLSEGKSGNRHDEFFIIVKHAVHLSAIQSLWNQPETETMVAAKSSEKTQQAEVDRSEEPYEFKNETFDAPVMISAGDSPMQAESGFVSPALFDVDNDGDVEMVLGGIAGEVFYCENTATNGEPVWGKAQPVKLANGKDLQLQNW